VGTDACLAAVQVLQRLGCQEVQPNRGDPTNVVGRRPPLQPGQYYVESWAPDWMARDLEFVIHVEVDPSRPLPEGFPCE
jgi:hypothetical protein